MIDTLALLAALVGSLFFAFGVLLSLSRTIP